MRGFFGHLTGMAVALAAASAAAGESGAKAAKAAAGDKDLHRLSVFSYIQDWRGRGGAVPVLMTIRVQGGDALSAFCNNVPRVQARVLQTLLNGTRQAGNLGRGLGALQMPLRREMLRMFPEKSLQELALRVGRTPSEFTKDLTSTDDACRALKS